MFCSAQSPSKGILPPNSRVSTIVPNLPTSCPPGVTPGDPWGMWGPKPSPSPPPSAPQHQPEVAIGLGPHLEWIRDLPCSQILPDPGPGGAVGHGGLAAMAERWVTPPSQHSGGFCHPQLTAQPGPGSGQVPVSSCQHSPVLPSSTLTFAEASCDEQGGHWKRQEG